MSCVSKDGKGWRILFVAPDGARKTLRLGRTDKKTAESISRHVDALLSARIAGQPIPRETATWLSRIGEPLYGRLVRVGLVEGRPSVGIEAFLTEFLALRERGYKPSSLVVWRQVAKGLVRFFGADRPLASLTPADAEAFRQHLVQAGLRATTVHKRLQHARMFFAHALRQGFVEANPFAFVRHRPGDVTERRAYVPADVALRVIEVAPNWAWRLLIALSRFGGLRVPSEALSLRWADVLWDAGRLVVPSPKTEHLAGRGYRVIPMFPELRFYLEEAWAAAEEGAEYIFPLEFRRRAQGPAGWVNCNLRTTFLKLIRRAGVEPWPRLWHSMRASCETDLAKKYPLAAAARWLGNTQAVALRHYVDVTDGDFERARKEGLQLFTREQTHSGTDSGTQVAQNPAQQGAATGGKIGKIASEPVEDGNDMQRGASHNLLVHKDLMERRRFELPTSAVRLQRSPN